MQIEQIIVITNKVKKVKVKLIWLILMQYKSKQNPSIISNKPDGFIFFKEIPKFTTLLGGLIIILAGIYIFYKSKDNKKVSWEPFF